MPDSSVARLSRVVIPVDGITLDGELTVPDGAHGVVLFAHGSGSNRKSTRDSVVAAALNRAGTATFLFDLLTAEETLSDAITGRHRFDIALLARRLLAATAWLSQLDALARLPVGYFGANTGAAAALVAAALEPQMVQAVVTLGGRTDLAGHRLADVHAPTLLIVGGHEEIVLSLNQRAHDVLHCVKCLQIVPNATHLFIEPGAMREVTELAGGWFSHFLTAPPATLPEAAAC